MSVLLDTNILLRRIEPAHHQHRVTIDTLLRLNEADEAFYVVPQGIAEFWAAATRPPAANGLGLPVAAAAAELAVIEQLFTLQPDVPEIYAAWKHLVITHQVVGKQVYDARLAAACLVHGFDHILTFNAADFGRYGVQVMNPAAGS